MRASTHDTQEQLAALAKRFPRWKWRSEGGAVFFGRRPSHWCCVEYQAALKNWLVSWRDGQVGVKAGSAAEAVGMARVE